MRSTSIKLAAFTLFTILITFYLASVIGRLTPFADNYTIDAVFTDAAGVLNGDPVTVAGVTIGKVTTFRVEDGEAIVRLEINGDVELPETTQAEIKYRNLLGQRVINLLQPAEASDEMLEEGDAIPVTQTRPALDLSVVFNNLRPLINSTNPEEINTVARSVLKIFRGREEDLAALLGNVGEISHTLADGDQRLARLVTDLDDVAGVLNGQSRNIRTSLSQFTAFMESLADVTPTIERVVDRFDVANRRFGGLIARNRTNLDRELEDLDTVLTVANQNLGPVARIAKNLKELLLATARSQSYGRWWNLYVVNFCPELPTGNCIGLQP